jgi:type II secretory pathway pseudopilin PulG
MMSHLPQRLLWVVLAMLGMLGTWLLGSYQNQRDVDLQLSELQAELAARLHLEQVTLAGQQQKLNQLTRAREVAEARSEALQQLLDDSLRQSSEDVAELALYRRIASEDAPSGLWVDNIRWANVEPDMLQVTVVQSRGRDRATGVLDVTVVDAQGEALKLPPTPFDLRFFQTLLVKVDNIATLMPEFVDVSIKPENAALGSGTERVRWDEIER